MKKTYLFLFALLPLLSFAQQLEFKNCDNPACNQKMLRKWKLYSQKKIFDSYGIAYNDDLKLELSMDGGELILEEGSAWINPDAVEIYFDLLKNKIIGISGNKERITVQIDQNPDFPVDFPNINDGLDSKFPEVKRNRDLKQVSNHGEFNQEALKGVYRYYRSKHWEKCVNHWRFPENFSAKFYYHGGRLKQVEIFSCEANSKHIIPALLELKAFDSERCSPTSFVGCTNYIAKYQSFEYIRDFYNLIPELEQSLNSLASLSNPITKINRFLNFHNLPLTFYQASDDTLNARIFKFYQDLYKTGITNDLWWSTVSQEAEKETDIKKFIKFTDLNQIPLWENCNLDADLIEQKTCFHQGIMNHLRTKYIFPKNAVQRGIHGQCYVNFIIEKDGSISNIEIVKGLDSLIDLEALRAISTLPHPYMPPTQNGNTFRMKYTLPLNLELK